jgi:hypothetical protein
LHPSLLYYLYASLTTCSDTKENFNKQNKNLKNEIVLRKKEETNRKG